MCYKKVSLHSDSFEINNESQRIFQWATECPVIIVQDSFQFRREKTTNMFCRQKIFSVNNPLRN